MTSQPRTPASAVAGLLSNVALKPLNTFAFDVHARSLFKLQSIDQLPDLLALCTAEPSPLILGGGSNVLLTCDLDTLVIHNRLHGIQASPLAQGRLLLEVAAGESWHHVVRRTVADGWWGLENLSLIPGSAGASPIQNIGAYGVELKDVFHSLDAIHLRSGERRVFSAEHCQFGYRDSVFKHAAGADWLITAVRLVLTSRYQPNLTYRDLAERVAQLPETVLTPKLVSDLVCAIRREKLPDPAELPNAGSFFKNPVVSAAQFELLRARYPQLAHYPLPSGDYKLAAAWLIDQLGWKGRVVDGAGVHNKQALVLLNLGGGPQAVLALAEQIRRDVSDNYGVDLAIEPVIVGSP